MSLVDRLRPAPRALGPAPAFGRSATGWRDDAHRDNAGSDRHRPPADVVRSLAVAIGRYRRLIAASCVALAVMIGLGLLTSHPASGTAVVAAAHDLPTGTTLTAADLRSVILGPKTVPAGAITEVSAAVGHTTSGALRTGEPLTDVRLSIGPLAAPARGMVASA
ncbi:MAG: SAF domain-containing protein, partial [Acidothermaceae bacterium]